MWPRYCQIDMTKEHDGSIPAVSVPGKTVFQVRLPINPAPRIEDSANS